jgi:hypothetical protein
MSQESIYDAKIYLIVYVSKYSSDLTQTYVSRLYIYHGIADT